MKAFKKILCALFGHRWRWYLPNYESTVVGTQYCTRCLQMRGVLVDQRNKE